MIRPLLPHIAVVGGGGSATLILSATAAALATASDAATRTRSTPLPLPPSPNLQAPPAVAAKGAAEATPAAAAAAAPVVVLGTLFELRVMHILAAHRMHLARVGGANDHGIDLRGSWDAALEPAASAKAASTIPTSLPVIVQCKHESRKFGPANVREFEGVMMREPPGTVGVLATNNGFSDAAKTRVFSSQFPLLCLVHRVDFAARCSAGDGGDSSSSSSSSSVGDGDLGGSSTSKPQQPPPLANGAVGLGDSFYWNPKFAQILPFVKALKVHSADGRERTVFFSNSSLLTRM